MPFTSRIVGSTSIDAVTLAQELELVKSPSHRPASAAALVEGLERLLPEAELPEVDNGAPETVSSLPSAEGPDRGPDGS